jgi:hypothetical protein
LQRLTIKKRNLFFYEDCNLLEYDAL